MGLSIGVTSDNVTAGDTQTVTVTVSDQNSTQPVQNALVLTNVTDSTQFFLTNCNRARQSYSLRIIQARKNLRDLIQKHDIVQDNLEVFLPDIHGKGGNIQSIRWREI